MNKWRNNRVIVASIIIIRCGRVQRENGVSWSGSICETKEKASIALNALGQE